MKRVPFLIFLIGLVFLCPNAEAKITAREIQVLAFGNLVVTGAPPLYMVIKPDGTQTHDSGITLLPGGSSVHMWRNGVCLLSGFTPGANVTVTISTPFTTQLTKGSSSFDISNFTLDTDYDPQTSTYVANGAGTITVLIGATLATNAAAGSYSDGPYRGAYTLDLTVDY